MEDLDPVKAHLSSLVDRPFNAGFALGLSLEVPEGVGRDGDAVAAAAFFILLAFVFQAGSGSFPAEPGLKNPSGGKGSGGE